MGSGIVDHFSRKELDDQKEDSETEKHDIDLEEHDIEEEKITNGTYNNGFSQPEITEDNTKM